MGKFADKCRAVSVTSSNPPKTTRARCNRSSAAAMSGHVVAPRLALALTLTGLSTAGDAGKTGDHIWQ